MIDETGMDEADGNHGIRWYGWNVLPLWSWDLGVGTGAGSAPSAERHVEIRCAA